MKHRDGNLLGVVHHPILKTLAIKLFDGVLQELLCGLLHCFLDLEKPVLDSLRHFDVAVEQEELFVLGNNSEDQKVGQLELRALCCDLRFIFATFAPVILFIVTAFK